MRANSLITNGHNIDLQHGGPDGYFNAYEITNGKRQRIGAVGNAAGLRWLLAMREIHQDAKRKGLTT